MQTWVYRRPFDYRAPRASWLLLRPDLTVTAAEQALTLTEQAAAVVFGRAVQGNAGSLALTGQASVVSFSPILYPFRDVPPLAPYPIGGVYRAGYVVRRARAPFFPPEQVFGGDLQANRGALTLSGVAASVEFFESTRNWIISEAVRQAALRRQLVERVRIDTRPWDDRLVQFTYNELDLHASVRPLTITGQASVVKLNRAVAAQVSQLALSEAPAAVRLGKAIGANVATLVLTGRTATVSTGGTIAAILETLALTGQLSDTDLDKSIGAGSANLVLSELVASLGAESNIAASVAVLALVGAPASIELEKAIAALAANLILNEVAATVTLTGDTQASAAELALDEHTAAITFGRLLSAAFDQLTLAQQQAIVTGSQAVIVTIGRRTIRVRARHSTITVH